ncbi:PREDICTED: uncharacterized protein LOC105151324 [Acromyrmex echinatior]|uniref:uncharacterized protein LOC105151324 n=1 Tax=Acromyrmex echinatior TaxID=103372 RepID=UPI000580C8A9|nr:PREDICTED: uncharacterized protein LOC105151324 [Acromyrmex echinatior]
MATLCASLPHQRSQTIVIGRLEHHSELVTFARGCRGRSRSEFKRDSRRDEDFTCHGHDSRVTGKFSRRTFEVDVERSLRRNNSSLLTQLAPPRLPSVDYGSYRLGSARIP